MERKHQFDGSRGRARGFLRLLGAFFALAVSSATLIGGVVHAQSGDTPRVTRSGNESGFGREEPGIDPKLTERLQVRRNEDRQKQLVADTDKLLLLAQELHDAVAKSNKDTLSLTVLKKSDEIEKLAKSVKDRMRGY